jgi:hypothetical protein
MWVQGERTLAYNEDIKGLLMYRLREEGVEDMNGHAADTLYMYIP